MQKTEALENIIRKKVDKLERICPYLVSCWIAVESPQEHQQSGSPFRIRINMRIPPGHELVVSHDPVQGNLQDPLKKVIRDAFNTARIKLQRIVEQQRDEVNPVRKISHGAFTPCEKAEEFCVLPRASPPEAVRRTGFLTGQKDIRNKKLRQCLPDYIRKGAMDF